MKYFLQKTFKTIFLTVLSILVITIVTITISRNNNIAAQNEQKPTGKVIILTDNTFEQTVKKGITLVDFWATWCGPCKTQGPIVDKVAEEIGLKAKICKLDTDKNPVVSSKYNITLIPTILIFKNGKVVQKYVGVQQKDILVKKIKELL